MSKELDAKDKLIKARIQLQKEKPFFSYLTMQLNFVEVKDGEITPTMGVDNYGNLYYNPKFVDGLNSQTCKGVLSHEVMHCALEHLTRRKNRNPELWNICNDALVNYIVKADGMSLPNIGLVPHTKDITLFGVKIKGIDDKSSEEIFDEIYQKIRKREQKVGKALHDWIKKNAGKHKGFDTHIEKQGQGNKKKDKEGQGGGVKLDKNGKPIAGTGQGDNENPLNTTEKNWKKVLIDACTFAKQRGSLPAGMKRMVDKLLETHIDWKGLLYRYITNQIPVDYVWTRPSKRSISTGIYQPSIEKEKIDVVVWIDTSGSISQSELQEFMTEVISIVRTFRNVDLTIGDCDCRVNSVKTYKNATITDALKFELRGGGGTSHVPVYNWMNKNMPTARLMINFTDGYTEFPNKRDVHTNTIWVVAGSYRASSKEFPFGEVIELPVRRN